MCVQISSDSWTYFSLLFLSVGEANFWVHLQGAVWGKLVQHLLIQRVQTWRLGTAILRST